MSPKPKKPKGTLVSRARGGDKAALARVLGNPALRSKLPDSQLPQKLLQRRRAQQEYAARRDPATVRAPMAPIDIDREAGAAANVRYGEQGRQLDQERNRSVAQHQNINDWYGQYLQDAETARKRTEETYRQAGEQVTQRQDQAATRDTAQAKEIGAEQQKDAELRGTTANPENADRAAQASANRRALTDSFGAMLQSVGANAVAHMVDQGRIGSGARTAAHMRETGVTRQIDEQRRGLAGDKGNFQVEYRGQLREGERAEADRRHRRRLERKAYGLDVSKAAAAVADDVADNEAAATKSKQQNKTSTQKQNDSYLQKYGMSRDAFLALSPAARQALIAKSKKSSSATGKSQAAKNADKERTRLLKVREKSSKVIGKVETASSVVESYRRTSKKPLNDDALRILLADDGYSAAVIDAALARARGSTLTPAQVKALNREGARIPRTWLPPRSPVHPGKI